MYTILTLCSITISFFIMASAPHSASCKSQDVHMGLIIFFLFSLPFFFCFLGETTKDPEKARNTYEREKKMEPYLQGLALLFGRSYRTQKSEDKACTCFGFFILTGGPAILAMVGLISGFC